MRYLTVQNIIDALQNCDDKTMVVKTQYGTATGIELVNERTVTNLTYKASKEPTRERFVFIKAGEKDDD